MLKRMMVPGALVLGMAIASLVTLGPATQTAEGDGHKMSHKGLPVAPEFTLTDANGVSHNLSDFRGKHVVLEWFNPGCPFVVKFYRGGKMQELQKKYGEEGVVWLSIASTNPGHKDYLDAAGLQAKYDNWKMASAAILRDDDGAVGKLYKAETTPHMYIINPDGKLIYQGAIDSIRSASSSDIASAENYVETVLDAVLLSSTKAYGCSVKY